MPPKKGGRKDLMFDLNFRKNWGRLSPREQIRKTLQNPSLMGTVMGPEKFIPKALRDSRHMNFNEFEHYMQKCRENDGFDVRGCTGRLCGGVVEETRLDILEIAAKSAKFAVKQNNEDKGSGLEFEELIMAMSQFAKGVRFYITFKAFDKSDGQSKIYRTKVVVGPKRRGFDEKYGEMAVESFFLAPTDPPPQPQEDISPPEHEQIPSVGGPRRKVKRIKESKGIQLRSRFVPFPGPQRRSKRLNPNKGSGMQMPFDIGGA